MVAQILLFGEGQQFDIAHAADILGREPELLHFIAVKRNVFVHPAHHVPQAFVLQGAQLGPRHAFHGRVPNHMLHRYPSP
jgi:hypothetical protein